ncbi:recombinase family protein [Streptomyces sp. NPDC056669]|uniref:recombinase family protein n=1 Tax=unclassified Streptomyces TaxID=2593676 RepID=UPI0036C4F08A
MANLVYKRVPTDQQSTDRQNLGLDEAGIEDPVVFEEQAGTFSRLHPLERTKFGELLTYARPGDTVHISEMFRLVRGTGHMLDVLHRDRLALRIHDGVFSAMDLTARHPRTGELLSTVKFMVQTLAAAGELQHDLQRELTYDGLRAGEAKGNKGGAAGSPGWERPTLRCSLPLCDAAKPPSADARLSKTTDWQHQVRQPCGSIAERQHQLRLRQRSVSSIFATAQVTAARKGKIG